MLSEIGLIGLGVMGKNIALNIAEKGTFVKAFNGSRSKIDLVGKEFDDMFEDVTPGPVELGCPSCGGLISITTTQRPIQVGCPICASQFVIRE